MHRVVPHRGARNARPTALAAAALAGFLLLASACGRSERPGTTFTTTEVTADLGLPLSEAARERTAALPVDRGAG